MATVVCWFSCPERKSFNLGCSNAKYVRTYCMRSTWAASGRVGRLSDVVILSETFPERHAARVKMCRFEICEFEMSCFNHSWFCPFERKMWFQLLTRRGLVKGWWIIREATNKLMQCTVTGPFFKYCSSLFLFSIVWSFHFHHVLKVYVVLLFSKAFIR